MSFVLHRAERADVLADVLAGILAQPLTDPFESEVVAIHAKGVERWLSHRISARLGVTIGRADGVAANIDFPFPGHLVGAALAAATGVDPATDPWRPERLVWPLLEVVDANLDQSWLSVLTAHLGRSDADGPDRNRRFATVRHLADLFDHYATNRSEMILAWAQGDDHDGNGQPLPAQGAWQAELWRCLRRSVATPSPAERLAGGCERLVAEPGLIALPSRFSLFGLTRLPASYLQVLIALGHNRDVALLALHPSNAAWEHVEELVRIGTDRSVGSDLAGAAAAAIRHPLLRSWGRDSREMHIVLSHALAGSPGMVEQHHLLPDPPTTSVLSQLQSALRADEAPPDPADRPLIESSDRSVQFHGCHGRARQAEVLREAVTHLLADDPTLEPRDILVLCPDIDDLAPLLRAAFDDGPSMAGDHVGVDSPPHIPYRMADRSLRQTNPVLGALTELLELIESRLTASEVLAFAALAPVRRRFGFDDDDLERFAIWIAETGIRWGLDGPHRAPFDLENVTDGTWSAGLDRLLLGVTMTEDGHRLVDGVLPLDDIDSGDIDRAGRFAELVHRLGSAVRSLQTARPIQGWITALDEAADRLMATSPADAWQRTQLDHLLTEVAGEAAGDSPGAASVGPPLRLAELRDLLADRLRGRPTRAAFRTGDLTMCTLVPMRSVPHRVVCLVGLDDGAFPRVGSAGGDDLMVASRHIGDHDRRSEDHQLLLDAVLSATEVLVVTYESHDVSTNERRPPAVPVIELLDLIDATVRTGEGGPARVQLVTDHPLQPADRRSFVPGALGRSGPWSFDRRQLAGARAASQPLSEPGRFLDGPLPAPAEQPVVALADLVAFVQHPVKAFLRQRLGLSLRTGDDGPIDSLTIDMDALQKWSVGDRLLRGMLDGGAPEAMAHAELARGHLPPGDPGRAIVNETGARATAVAAFARAMADGPRRSLDVDVALPDGRRLRGTVPDVMGTVIRPTTYSTLKAKQTVAAWVGFLAATASHPELGLASILVGQQRAKPSARRFTAPEGTAVERQAWALGHLTDLVALLDAGMCEPLPLYGATSHRYAEASRSGKSDPASFAEKEWKSGYDWDKEDRDPEHLRVLGGQIPLAAVLCERPRSTETGPGWREDEETRFGRLARRLWDPILAIVVTVADQ